MINDHDCNLAILKQLDYPYVFHTEVLKNYLGHASDELQYSRRHVSINRAAPRLPTTNSRRDCDILAWENRGDDVGLAWRGVARRGRGAERRG